MTEPVVSDEEIEVVARFIGAAWMGEVLGGYHETPWRDRFWESLDAWTEHVWPHIVSQNDRGLRFMFHAKIAEAVGDEPEDEDGCGWDYMHDTRAMHASAAVRTKALAAVLGERGGK